MTRTVSGAIEDQLPGSEVVSDVRALRSNVEAAVRAGERDFSERSLEGASLAGVDLDDTNFAGALLARADLAHASLRGAVFEGADLRQATAAGAVLEKANLERVTASEASLTGAKLGNARLGKARFDGAGFAEADLSHVDASEADLSGADFSGAKAENANFTRANLRGACLARADLRGANLSGADLRGARLDEANLAYADLSGAELSGASLARCDLTGARVAGVELPYAADHQNLGALADQDRALLFTLMGVCAYVLVSAATATDAQLALNRALVKLPVLDAELPLQLFFVGSGVVVFLTHLYLSLEQGRLIRALATLPRRFPDAAALSDRAHPWFVVVALGSWFGRVKPREREPAPANASSGQHWLLFPAVIVLIWGLAPITVAVLMFRFLGSQRTDQSYVLWAMLAASAVLSFSSFARARRARGLQSGRGMLVSWVFLGLALLGTLPGVLMGVRDFHLSAPRAELSTFEGGHWRGADLERATLVRADLRMVHLEQATLHRAHLDQAQLASANLTGAQAEFASFEGADLSAAVLERAVFWSGRLSRAILTQAHAPRADLRRADLQHVKARGANFEGALAEGTDFDNADLDSAVLKGLRAPRASFEGADLSGADLSGAVLIGANLRATRLAGVRLEGTDLSQVDLTGSSDLTLDQLCQARGWREALLPGDEAPDLSRPFRIDQAGPLRRHADALCPKAKSLDP